MNAPGFCLPPPATPYVPVAGGGKFPVRRIFCVGRNYADHVREMGGDPGLEPPIFFTKPADAIVIDGADTPYPPATVNLHHEMELVVAIGQAGADIPQAQALAHVFGYAAGLDMTRRDLQAQARAHGQPWDMAKAFDASAPIGAIAPAASIGHPPRARITLLVDGTTRQDSDIANMLLDVPGIIAALSALVRLEAGDLIFTGTPEGVGAVTRGALLHGVIAGIGEVRTRIV